MERNLFQPTNIETEMRGILDELSIEYATYFPIRLTNLELDFAIPNLKICIESDGTYWHKDRKQKDRRRDYYLKKLGWTTLRFSDDEIFNKRDEIKSKISEAVKNARNKN